jgi:hypothetical protein
MTGFLLVHRDEPNLCRDAVFLSANGDLVARPKRAMSLVDYEYARGTALFTNCPRCYEPRKIYAGQQQRNRAHAKCRKVKSRSDPIVTKRLWSGVVDTKFATGLAPKSPPHPAELLYRGPATY